MSQYFAIHGGATLEGRVAVQGAKNSVLKLMAASLLAPGVTTLYNCPEILDVHYMSKVLEGLGATVTITAGSVTIDSPEQLSHKADFPAMRLFRASVCVLGPLVARCRQAVVALPGGDAIGTRPLDMHRSGLEAMGAHTSIEHGCLLAVADNLRSADVHLPWPSVGATENIIMASVLSAGITIIDNAAREPEIVDLCTMLTKMGADIDGIGTSTLIIRGVTELKPISHRVIGDRLVGATWAAAAVMTKGNITITGIEPNDLQVVLDKFSLAGAEMCVTTDGINIKQVNRPKAINVSTLPYPGFPTDLQAMAIAIGSIAEGVSVITENVFEARFRFVEEMVRLGVDARVDGHHAVVRGREKLSSAPVWSSDVRAGAGLVLAGLCAEGVTQVHDVFHIDRGYPHFLENLTQLGAQLERIEQ